MCGVLGHLAAVHRSDCSVRCVACAVSWATWLLFTGVPAPCVVLCVRCPGPLGSCSPLCPLGALCCVCGVLSHLAFVHRCACSVSCFACAVSWATWLPFTRVPARCVALRVQCPGPLSSCSPMCPRGLFCSVCGVLGHLAPVHWCARSVHCFAGAVSWATGLLFTGVPAWFAVLRLRCPRPLGSCLPVHSLGALLCLCGVLGHLVRAHRCARSVCCVACAVSWATCLLFTGVRAPSFALLVRCPGQLGSCSPLCPLGALCCACGVLGKLARVHRGARSVCCVTCAVSRATSLLFTGAPVRCVALLVQCPRPLGFCSPVCPLGVLCCFCGVLGHLAPVHRCACAVLCLCLCGVLGHLAPVHRCASWVCCVACAVSWVTGHLFTRVPARCVALRVQWPGSLSSCSRMCPCGLLCCVCGVLGHLAPVHRCARWMRCFAGAVSWATWLLFTGVPAGCVVLRVRCPGSLGTCSLVCALRPLLCLCGVLGNLAPVHRCARSVLYFARAPSSATWLLFTAVPARCVVLLVRCPGPLGSCSPMCPLCPLLCLFRVLGHLAPGHRCAHWVCCVACAVSWATWLLFTGMPARCVALRVQWPGPLSSCSRMCPCGWLCSVCGVLGYLAPVHRCARSMGCFAGAVSWATSLLFTDVPARSVVLHARCPGPLATCSRVCALRPVLCLCGVLGNLAPVHRCARSVRYFSCAVYSATWLLFTAVPARCVVLLVRCPGPLGSCSSSCALRPLLCLFGVLGHSAPVHRCAPSVRCFVCAVAWAT